MINMYSEVKNLFPELYTRRGTLTKREPKKYVCSCGHTFNRTVSLRVGGIVFGQKTCEKCGKRATDSTAYNVWKRMVNGQVEQEDFILNTVKSSKTMIKEELKEQLNKQFTSSTNALITLVYFDYLLVNESKRENEGIIEYTVNLNKDLNKRYGLIR